MRQAFQWLASSASRGRFVVLTPLLMILFYAVLYQPYAEQSLPGRFLVAYLELVAEGSAAVLRLLGENVYVQGATVTGRFPYIVVLDCAALDAQALFAAAVIAFPARVAPKLVGLVGGLTLIGLINIARLVLLYFAGVRSVRLFQVMHEEVMVLLVVLMVCGLFSAWAWWATESARQHPQLDAGRAT